jgi:hypothetical protein
MAHANDNPGTGAARHADETATPAEVARSLQPTPPDTDTADTTGATIAPTPHGAAVGADWAANADIAAADRDDPNVDHANAPGPTGARPPEPDSALESLGKAITDPVMEASGEADQSDAGTRRREAGERARAQEAQEARDQAGQS